MFTSALPLLRSVALKTFAILSFALLQHTNVAAQTAGGPFFCDAQFYQTRVSATGTRLLRYPTLSSAPTNFYSGTNAATSIPNLGVVTLNALGFNNRDNFMYAITTVGTTGNVSMYRLGQSGAELVGQLPGVTDPFTTTAGVFDKQGRYYFAGQGGAAGGLTNTISPSIIYRVDNIPSSGTASLTIARSYAINVTPLLNFGDFAFSDAADGVNGILYGASNQGLGPQLAQIQLNDAAATANVTVRTLIGADTSGTGSAFYDQPTDRFYMFSNVNNAFYEIQNFAGASPNSVTTTAVLNAPVTDNTGTSDGTSCIFAGQQQADIGVNKTSSPSRPLAAGDTVTFTIVAFNVSGSSPAQNVTIRDQLPAGLSFVSAGTTAGTYFTGTSNWVIPLFPAGTTQTLTLIASVNTLVSPTASAILSNVAAVVGSSQVGTSTVIALTDPTPSNNTSTATVTASRSANLNITKTNNVNTPTALVAGQTTSYTITVSLATGTAAIDITNAILTDPAASGLRCVIGSPACAVTSTPTGSVCPTVGAGAGQLNIGNLQGTGVLIPLLKPGNQMSFKIDCGVSATGQ